MKKKLSSIAIISISIILDAAAVIVADLASFVVRFNGVFPQKNFSAYLDLFPLIMVARIVSFYMFRLYTKPTSKSDFEITITAMNAATISSTAIIFFVYFFDIVLYPRSIAAISWLFTIFTVSGWRFIMKQFFEAYLGKDYLQINLLIIGTGKHAQELAMNISRDSSVNYRIVGYLRTKKTSAVDVERDKVIGDISDIPDILQKFDVDEVVIADASFERRELVIFAPLLIESGVELKSAPTSYERVITGIMLSNIEASFAGPMFSKKTASWYWPVKRILDIIFSAILLILTMPILIAASLLIKATSPGPVLYLQKRTGQFGKRFIMYKLRTMRVDAENKKPLWAKKGDKRVTTIGRLLRRYRIDELPQLINVLKNDMSLIGPRPERPYFVHKLVAKIPFYTERLQVKPGITGWAQVNFKYSANEEEAEQKLVYDLFYTQNMSFSLDLLIALKTIRVVLAGYGAH